MKVRTGAVAEKWRQSDGTLTRTTLPASQASRFTNHRCTRVNANRLDRFDQIDQMVSVHQVHSGPDKRLLHVCKFFTHIHTFPASLLDLRRRQIRIAPENRHFLVFTRFFCQTVVSSQCVCTCPCQSQCIVLTLTAPSTNRRNTTQQPKTAKKILMSSFKADCTDHINAIMTSSLPSTSAGHFHGQSNHRQHGNFSFSNFYLSSMTVFIDNYLPSNI